MEGDRVSSFNHFFAVFVVVIMFNFLIYLILRQYFFKMTFLSFGLAFHVSDCCSPSCLCQSVSELIQPTIFIKTSIEQLNEFDLCLHFLNTIEAF